MGERHVATQTGTDGGGSFDPLNVFGFLGGQIGILQPTIFLLMTAGVLYAWRQRKADPADETTRRLMFPR